MSDTKKPFRFPDPVRAKILDLIQRDDVRSVSCPFDDPDIWRALVAEQIKRVTGTPCEPQDAFTLSGPEYLDDVPIEEWGGTVHLPFEGMCGGDLVVLPTWRNVFPDRAEKTGRLSTAVQACCHYVLTPRDFGEWSFATRTHVGDWILYTSKLPYTPCDPLHRRDPEIMENRRVYSEQVRESEDLIPPFTPLPAAVELLARVLEANADEKVLRESEQDSGVEDLIDIRIDTRQ